MRSRWRGSSASSTTTMHLRAVCSAGNVMTFTGRIRTRSPANLGHWLGDAAFSSGPTLSTAADPERQKGNLRKLTSDASTLIGCRPLSFGGPSTRTYRPSPPSSDPEAVRASGSDLSPVRVRRGAAHCTSPAAQRRRADTRNASGLHRTPGRAPSGIETSGRERKGKDVVRLNDDCDGSEPVAVEVVQQR
eukprot:6436040-Prymnesium_polylepis.1